MTFTKKVIIGVAVVALPGFFVFGVWAGAAVFEWKAAQRAGNEAAAEVNLKTIAAVEVQYYNTHNRTFGTLDQLVKEEMLSSRFSGNPAAVDGYIFRLIVTPKTSSQTGSYILNADPQSEAKGRKHFYLDSNSSGVRVNSNRPAGPNDPPPGE